jgi:hypothetical protein
MKKLRPMIDNRTLDMMIEDEKKSSHKRTNELLNKLAKVRKQLKTRSK